MQANLVGESNMIMRRKCGHSTLHTDNYLISYLLKVNDFRYGTAINSYHLMTNEQMCTYIFEYIPYIGKKDFTLFIWFGCLQPNKV